MSTVGFQLASPSKGSGGKMPRTFERTIATGYAEAQGALVYIDASNTIVACGADPTLIAGVAVTPGGTDTPSVVAEGGFNILGRKEFPPLSMQAFSIGEEERFIAPYVGTLPTNPGGQYGVIRDTDGVWKVDFNDDVNVVLTYTGNRNTALQGSLPLAICTFLQSVVQPV